MPGEIDYNGKMQTISAKISDLVRAHIPLWPLVAGLAFGRAGLIVASYGSYTSTDEGIYTDGAMLAALVVLGILLIIVAASKATLSKHVTNILMRTCVILEAACLVCLTALPSLPEDRPLFRFSLCALCALVSSGAIFYWLRRARGTGTTAAAVLVFLALIVSEAEVYLCTFLPVVVGNLFATALVLAQIPCMIWARNRTQPYALASPTQANDYFGFTKTMIQSKQFLVATAVGVGFLSIVIGLLRGYPNGEAIAFTPPTRAAYALLTVGISLVVIVMVLKGRQRVLTVGAFLVMELLACAALVAHAAFPDILNLGAVFSTTLNAYMVAFTWYLIIAFMSYGWRDPYYYAISGWLVWLGCRAGARMAILGAYGFLTNDLLVTALMGTLIVISTQVVLVQFLGIARRSAEEREEQTQQHASKLVKIMGLDEHENLASARQASMEHNAEEMGRQFLLSEREVEVLSLYALGHTQKRVAEELFITQGTAHAHIKRIYAKTGLHSRQEILDYLQQYTS